MGENWKWEVEHREQRKKNKMENLEESERLRREGRSGEEGLERAAEGQGQSGPRLPHIVLGSIHLNKGTILTCVPAGRGFVAFWVLVSSPPPILLPLLFSLSFPPRFHPDCIKVPPVPPSPRAFPPPPRRHKVPLCGHHPDDLFYLLILIYPCAPG